MATAGEEEVEYESDPEEAKRSLAMRRREASDDENEGEGEGIEKLGDRRVVLHSDESDGQGGVADYDEEDELDDEEEEDYEEEEEEYEEGDGIEGRELYEGRDCEGDAGRTEGSTVLANARQNDSTTHLQESQEAPPSNWGEENEEKKENEPFAVPTAGAFYMHDDRFRDNAGGRHRRTHGGRRLWESKDDRKWGHDKFEEMTLQERLRQEGRRFPKGNYRGWAKNRGIDRGYIQDSRKGYAKLIDQGKVPKGVRGRGSRRYEPAVKNSDQAPRVQNKLYRKPVEKNSSTSSSRATATTSNVECETVPARRQTFASNLNSASPPFYPSGASNRDITLATKVDIQNVTNSGNLMPNVMDEGFSAPHNSALLRGKNVANSLGMDKLYIDDLSNTAVGKSSPGSMRINVSQSPHTRNPGRMTSGEMSHQPGLSNSQAIKTSPALLPVQRNPMQSQAQTSVQAPAQQLGQRPGSGTQHSSPPKTSVAINSFEPGEVDSTPESSKSKNALVGKGNGSTQSSGKGSFLYGGAQVIGASGNMSISHGDQNFPATPAFLPFMQFGGQHPGGIRVPAVGMAFPGYVAQPQLGLGNSEMTWLPVLAGAAGALGGYCSPYLAVDGAYHARQSGETSSMSSSSKGSTTNKANNDLKPSLRPENAGDEFGQRQNKPRRYSEMNFGQ